MQLSRTSTSLRSNEGPPLTSVPLEQVRPPKIPLLLSLIVRTRVSSCGLSGVEGPWGDCVSSTSPAPQVRPNVRR